MARSMMGAYCFVSHLSCFSDSSCTCFCFVACVLGLYMNRGGIVATLPDHISRAFVKTSGSFTPEPLDDDFVVSYEWDEYTVVDLMGAFVDEGWSGSDAGECLFCLGRVCAFPTLAGMLLSPRFSTSSFYLVHSSPILTRRPYSKTLVSVR